MSAASTALSLNEIHVTRSTGLSLNERFTKITKNKLAQIENEKNSRRLLNQATSAANRLLIQKLQRKHKMEAALKLKRKSLRRFGSSGGQLIRRGTIKALRVGANGKPIRMNSLTKIATMKADHEVTNGWRSMRRSNSLSSLTGRLGQRRPSVGGAAERIAKRRLQRQAGRGGRSELYMNNNNIMAASESRRRSRSRSRIRGSGRIPAKRGRSRSTGRINNNNNNTNITNNRRSRSRTRNRPSPSRNNVPIKARLGVRGGTHRNDNNSNNNMNNNNNTNKNRNRRNPSLTTRGVIRGRIQKVRSKNFVQKNAARFMGGRGLNGRRRGRSAVRNILKNSNIVRTRSRSRSRARKNQGQVGQQIQKQQRPLKMAEKRRQQQNNGRRQRRGRNQQRRSNSVKRTTNNNSQNSQIGKQQQQQQRPNRTRSRSRNRINRGNNSQANQTSINKDDLDKELDQYMATTKDENNVDYLLKH